MNADPRLGQLFTLWRDARARGDPELAELALHSLALEFPEAVSAASNQTQQQKQNPPSVSPGGLKFSEICETQIPIIRK
jgi:hypothetical protein